MLSSIARLRFTGRSPFSGYRKKSVNRSAGLEGPVQAKY